ncbi:hypothetical protein IQ255_07720 [Pleurocapsales cyanobacterium LEGE 10410]|nr:hypothetical protein [Pleurocapsales cyanobacterium LEGE 10410]
MIRIRHLLKYLSIIVLVILAINTAVTTWVLELIRAYPLSTWWLLGGMSESLVGIDDWIRTDTGGIIATYGATLFSALVIYQIIRLVTEEWYYTYVDEDISAEKVGALILKYLLVIIPLIVLNPFCAWFLTRLLLITLIDTYLCNPDEYELIADIIGLCSFLAMSSTADRFIEKYLEELTYPTTKL